MTTLYIFTEEPSIRIVFEVILKAILPANVSYAIYAHQGKQDLEKALRTTLPTISKIPGAKILITRDQDNEDCKTLKSSLLEIIEGSCVCDFRIRIICRELEAWFLGDLTAISKAYPRFKAKSISGKTTLRNVDTISQPHKYLLKQIPEFSKRNSLPKLEVAEAIAKNMVIEENKSESFKQTLRAICELTGIII